MFSRVYQPTEWVSLIHESYGDLFDSKEQECGPLARFSLCECCAQGLFDQCCETQRECFGGSSRDFCQCFDDDSLMRVSQRHEADSLDSAVFSEYEEDSANVSELAVPEHQIDQEIDCWSCVVGV